MMYGRGVSSGKILVLCSAALLALITAGHYLTDAHNPTLHHTYRRLYYMPVVLMAFAYGWRGGLMMAISVSAAYAPHAFFMDHHHRDPAPTSDKLFELLLYALVGLLTGTLVDRERATQRHLRAALQEREQLEEALIRSAKMSALGHLLAGVAHELRNPLASILGTTEGLERQLERPPQERGERSARLLSLQRKELERLDRTLSRFLAFAHTKPPEPTWVSLDELVARVIELTQHQAVEGSFELSEALRGQRAWVDEDQLLQVLLNLTLNATQASGARPFQVSYRFERELRGGAAWCRLGVIDLGEGLSDEDAQRAFEPFFSTRVDGTGLGLSLSRQLIEAHGGELQLERLGEETRLWVCLPLPADGEPGSPVTRGEGA